MCVLNVPLNPSQLITMQCVIVFIKRTCFVMLPQV